MFDFSVACLTQSLTFLPLAMGITLSYRLLNATDLTLDGSFVLGAGIFAKLITLPVPPYIAALCALFLGGLAGMMVALFQKKNRVNPLLAGVLASFILTSANLALMGHPNISLLNQPSLIPGFFTGNEFLSWSFIGLLSIVMCIFCLFFLSTRFGLILRALGQNGSLLQTIGYKTDFYRLMGFALSNLLAAAAGLLTAQTVGYADINMGLGMTLTGIGAIILGEHVLRLFGSRPYLRIISESFSCLLGVLLYFVVLNLLLRLNINPVYLKMVLGFALVLCLHGAALQKGESTT